jgi:hypothetical protein
LKKEAQNLQNKRILKAEAKATKNCEEKNRGKPFDAKDYGFEE